MTRETFPPPACPAPETLGALAEGRLAGPERAAAVRHLAGCRRCHEVFASTVQILEDEGLLPVDGDAASAATPRRATPTVWLSAAAAALVSAVVFVQRAPVAIPRVVDASPGPAVSPTAAPPATPGPASAQTAPLPPEAIEALRTLRGFHSPYAVPPGAGFAPNPRGRAVAQGIADIDTAARVVPSTPSSPVPPGAMADDWRRVGRILEASRLALLDPEGDPDTFFASTWASAELAHAASLLRKHDVADAAWPEDARRRGASTPQDLLERLDALLESLR